MKTNKIYLAVILAGVLAAGCSRQEILEPSGDLEFTATLADAAGTKTVLQNDTDIYWQTSEFINIFYGDSMAGQFYSTNAQPAATATFRGSLASVSGAAGVGTDYWAVYPYDREAVCDGTSVTLTLPATQTGMAGTFANNLFPAVAKSASRTLQFYNVCGGARFSVTQPGITAVTFRSVGGQALAGKVKVGFDADGKPQVTEVLDGVSEVSVTAPEGGFEVGKNYFVALLPGTLPDGIAMTFLAGGSVTTQVLDRSITIRRAVFGMLDEAENGIWDTAHQYFTITSETYGNTISFSAALTSSSSIDGTFWYSLDKGASWTEIGSWSEMANFSHTLNNGETLSLKGDLDKTQFGYQIHIPGAAKVSGNIMSLVAGDRFADAVELNTDYAFYNLFHESAVADASDLILPATTLAYGCYSGMFRDCASLTSAPELPATTLADACYFSMFRGCTNLSSAPELPATTLANSCYLRMFGDCTSLTSAPELPATTLTYDCYGLMFIDCIGLTSAPELPATTLVKDCYRQMFGGCSQLSYVKALFTTAPSDDYTKAWLSGVAATGTFVKADDATWTNRGVNAVPEGWIIEGGRIPVESVSMDPTSLTLLVGGQASLSAAVSPVDAADPSVSWTSSDERIATVDGTGKVTAIAVGTATITVTTTDGGKTATCAVTVNPVPVASVTLDKDNLNFCSLNATQKLNATVGPDNATNKAVTWSSSNESVAVVASDGTVTSRGTGEATITVTTEDGGKTANCTVTVFVPVTSVVLDQTSATIEVGASLQLTATVNPGDASEKGVTWTSSNADIATVTSDGTVKGIAVGEVTITVTSKSDNTKTATCRVKVDPISVPGTAEGIGYEEW